MANFDPNQPRNEEGEWTIAEGAARIAAGLDPVGKTLNELAEKLVDSKTEWLYVIDPETGEILASKEGTKSSCGLDTDQVYLYEDNIVVHNHPGGSKKARLSEQDIYVIHDCKEKQGIVIAGDFMVVSTRMPNWEYKYNQQGALDQFMIQKMAEMNGYLDWKTSDKWSGKNPKIQALFVEGYKLVGLDTVFKKWR